MSKYDYPVKPVPFTKVQIIDQFWSSRIETNRKVTIPYALEMCEKTGRIDNFSKAAGLIDIDREPCFPFDDSDVFKIIEGAAYSLNVKPDPKLEKYIDNIIDKIAAAQEEDGYLYTTRTINPEKPHIFAGKKRWELVSVMSHELYNAGHLIEGAIAYYQATGKRKLLDVAIKLADLIDKEFGPGKIESVPGHQVIEMALASLCLVTNDERYLKLAKFFLDIRGSKDWVEEYMKLAMEIFPNVGLERLEYNQSHEKVVEQDEAVGHAVRATYMYSGMADVAALTDNKEYIKALKRIWENVVYKKLSITGGIGSQRRGEAFGRDYKLPNIRTYNETCAAIGNVFWNHRLFLLHGDAKYIDVLERTLYNGLISGVSLDGKSFFYPNPLASRGRHERSPWFDCACCPSNITRFMASIPDYIYASREKMLYINLFVGSTATVNINGKDVSIIQETDYPWNGDVKVTVKLQGSVDFITAVRIPGWTQDKPVPSDLYRYLNKNDAKVSLKVNSEPIDLDIKNGYVFIERTWNDGDVFELNLPMPIKRVVAHEKVREDEGKVALERGPIVYCVEWPDNEVENLFRLFIDDDAKLMIEHRKDMLNGIVVIKGHIHYLKRVAGEENLQKIEQDFLAIPYYAWAHRGKGRMTVWLLRDLKALNN